MPVVDVNGEKKKVACGPCIRGHRSSKCQHSDRVLIEVRKPGRPLSACPHPSGTCSCQRAVFYAVPKNESNSIPSGSASPTAAGYPPSIPLPANRVQKSKLRKNSTVTPATVQRGFDGDPSILAQHVNQRNDPIVPTESSESSSTVPSLASSTSSTPQTEAIDAGMQHIKTQSPTSTDSPAPLQLGMMGLGGYRAADQVGWSGEWPDYHSIPPLDSGLHGMVSAPAPQPAPKQGSCCANKAAAPPQPSQVDISNRTPSAQPATSAAGRSAPAQLDFTFTEPMSHHGAFYSYRPPTFDFNSFPEDSFGCSHQPDQQCQCGEGCECLGCSIHPANRTTTDYVRYHAMQQLPPLQMPPPGYGQMASYGGPLQSPSRIPGQHALMGQPQYTQPYGPQPVYTPQWQNAPQRQPIRTPTTEFSQFHIHPSPIAQNLPPNMSQPRMQETPRPNAMPAGPPQPTRQKSFHETNLSADPVDHESPSTEDDASTLSPSMFSIQHFDIPGCNDATGNCLCGEGCQCVGCLTHSGHDKVSSGVAEEARGSGMSSAGPRVGPVNGAGAYPQPHFDDILREPLFSPTVPS